MIFLHLSKQIYTRSELIDYCDRAWSDSVPDPIAVCSNPDRGYVIKRGIGPGLVPNGAISKEAHCPDCVDAILGCPS